VDDIGLSGLTVFVCGSFSTIRGQARNHIAALNAVLNRGNATVPPKLLGHESIRAETLSLSVYQAKYREGVRHACRHPGGGEVLLPHTRLSDSLLARCSMRARPELPFRFRAFLILGLFIGQVAMAGGVTSEDASGPGAGGGRAAAGVGAENALPICANPALTDAELQVDAAQGLAAKGGPVINSLVTIPVAFHVIRSTDGLSYDVDDEQLEDQIDVLNDAYSGTSFQFELLSIDRTNNSVWASYSTFSADEFAMATALGIDQATTLNFFVRNIPDGLGSGRTPNEFTHDPEYDGVNVHYTCLPGGSHSTKNLGHVGTHEVGHWLGLLHTFEGGCSGDGDGVNDTPAEASPASGCPTGRDTCPSAGDDPIHNYMDYTDDSCQNELTAGQSARMDFRVATYRQGLVWQPITDLSFAAGRTTGTLTWTAPADWGGGQVTGYAVRYSPAPINTEYDWNNAYTYGGTHSAQSPGNTECLDISGLASCTWYYWAVKSLGLVSGLGVISPLSNTSGAKTRCTPGGEIMCFLAPSGPVGDRLQLPQALTIGQIAPNPARSPITIALAIPSDRSGDDIELAVFDVAGRQIRSVSVGAAQAGFHSVDWDLQNSAGQDVPNGVYFVRVAVGDIAENRRVLIAR
jgi:hypothetical protein